MTTNARSQFVRRPQAPFTGWARPAAAACRRRRRWQPCLAAASEGGNAAGGDGAQPGSNSGGGSGGSSSGSSSFQRSPWELMGRVVREERVALQGGGRGRLDATSL